MEVIYVTDARHLHDYTLEITFHNGSQQVIDFGPQINRIRIPEYLKYRNVEQFKQFAIEDGN